MKDRPRRLILYCPVSPIGFWYNHMAGSEREARRRFCLAMGFDDWREAKKEGFRMAKVKIQELT